MHTVAFTGGGGEASSTPRKVKTMISKGDPWTTSWIRPFYLKKGGEGGVGYTNKNFKIS